MPSVKVPLPPLKSVFGDAFQQCKNGPEVLTLVSKTAIPLSYGDACHALTHLANFGDFKRGSREFKDFISKLDTQVFPRIADSPVKTWRVLRYLVDLRTRNGLKVCMPWFEKVLPQCEPHMAIDVLYRLYRISGVHVKYTSPLMQTALQKTFAHLDKGEFDKVSAKDLYRLVYALGVFRVRGPPLRRALAAVTPALLEAYRNGKGAEIGCEGLVRIAWCIGRVIGDNDEDWCETPEWKQVQRLLKGTAKEVRLLLDSLDNKDLLILEDVYGKAEANYKPFLKDVKAAKATISYYGAPPPPKRHINDPRRVTTETLKF